MHRLSFGLQNTHPFINPASFLNAAMWPKEPANMRYKNDPKHKMGMAALLAMMPGRDDQNPPMTSNTKPMT